PEEHGENGFPTLVVASKTVVNVWKRDGFEKFFNGVKVLYLHKTFTHPSVIDKVTRKELVKYDFVVTTYDFVSCAAKAEDDWKDSVVFSGDGRCYIDASERERLSAKSKTVS